MFRALRCLLYLVLAAGCASAPPPQEEAPPGPQEAVEEPQQDPRERPLPDDVPAGILVDDADRERVEITAFWQTIPSAATRGGYGPTVLSDGGVGADGVVRFRPELESAGRYEVFLYWPELRASGAALATNAPVTVRHAGGTASFTVDLRREARSWKPLGSFLFDPEAEAYVEIRNDAADGIVLADAVLFRPTGEGNMGN